MNAAVAMANALSLSLLANVGLGNAYLNQRDRAGAAETRIKSIEASRDDARALASACSDATEDLRELAAKRQREATDARELATKTAKAHDRKADEVLSAPAPVPGNACASAELRANEWLKSRWRP